MPATNKTEKKLCQAHGRQESAELQIAPHSLISLQYHITTTQHHYQIMDMVTDGSEGRRAKTHSDSTNFSGSADMFSLPRAFPSGALFGPSCSHLEQIRA